MADELRVSAVICTHNRADKYLPKALESLRSQTLSPGAFEVVVVDNASTDATAEVVAAAQARFSARLHYQREPQLGVSFARNLGWKTARSSIVCYLDDDAVASPGWLEDVDRAFAGDREGRIGAVGGPVEAIWEVKRPAWLEKEMEGALGIFPGAPQRGVTEYLVGGNVAYRRDVLFAVGGFAPSLGRRGKQLINAEDDDMHERIRNAGYQLHYWPEMSVHHHVPAERLNRSYLLRWAFGSGLGLARMRCRNETATTTRVLRWVIEAFVRLPPSAAELRALVARRGHPHRLFFAFERRRRLGRIAGFLSAARHG